MSQYLDYIFIAIHIFVFLAEVLSSIFQHRKINKICNECGIPHSADTSCTPLSKWYYSYLTASNLYPKLTQADANAMLADCQKRFPEVYTLIVERYNMELENAN